ncbi:MAG TPA: hypothetical protein PKC91_04500 [Ignavibacteria bacterium]|nr:hypothetical protein [Ignavibacteria bacterium]
MIPEGVNLCEWKYKVIFRIKDEQVGQFSDVISVMVKRKSHNNIRIDK